jgi:hypothetical protein
LNAASASRKARLLSLPAPSPKSGAGSDYVRMVIVMTVDAADVAEAFDAAWWAFLKAAGGNLASWDTAAASAEVRPD